MVSRGWGRFRVGRRPLGSALADGAAFLFEKTVQHPGPKTINYCHAGSLELTLKSRLNLKPGQKGTGEGEGLGTLVTGANLCRLST